MVLAPDATPAATELVFADDARQTSPTRPGMGPLVATGGLIIPADTCGWLETQIHQTCADAGFPEGEEFKWSPRRGTWMHSNLTGDRRRVFFDRVLGLARQARANAIVVVEDTNNRPAVADQTPAFDTVIMFIERVESLLQAHRSTGLVITDRPGGDRAAEDRFLTNCLEVLLTGTRYVTVERIPINVLSTSSHLVRLLQLADLVTSCTTAYVAGEANYAPAVFPAILAIAHRDYDCVGGRGIKIHPDFRYRNLYHWLFGDEDFVRFQGGVPLPMAGFAYATGPQTP
jgi:hypothetical protein